VDSHFKCNRAKTSAGAWKIRLIEEMNPGWVDLLDHLGESFSF
jgi:predicted GIY-YIG superfamily endonuclease